MRRLLALLLTACPVLAGCKEAPPIPAEDLGIEVLAPLEPVTPARAFDLTLVRRWHKRLGDLAGDGAWERAFAPLVVRLARVERREDAQRVEETRVYHAYAMSRSDVVVAPVAWRPASAPNLAASTPRLTLRVRPEVDADDPGPSEIPPTPAAPPSRAPSAWIAGALALALLLLARARLRTRAATTPASLAPAPPDSAAFDAAREALAALAGQPAPEVVAEATRIVRLALERRLKLPALCRTREELLAAADARACAPPALDRLLALADHAHYGRHAPTDREAAQALDDARAALDALSGPRGAP